MQLKYVSTVVTLPGNLFNESIPEMIPRQAVGVSEDEIATVYDFEAMEWLYHVRIRVSDAQRAALRSFLWLNVNFAKYPFEFTPDGVIDAGRGAGHWVWVRYISKSLVEIPISPGRWEVTFVLRANSTGESQPPGET